MTLYEQLSQCEDLRSIQHCVNQIPEDKLEWRNKPWIIAQRQYKTNPDMCRHWVDNLPIRILKPGAVLGDDVVGYFLVFVAEDHAALLLHSRVAQHYDNTFNYVDIDDPVFRQCHR